MVLLGCQVMGVRTAAGWVGGGLAGYRLWRAWRRRLTRLDGDHAAYWRRRARTAGEIHYVALGDSLSQGLSARNPDRGFVGRLAAHWEVRTGRSVEVTNLSVTGATIANLLTDQLPRLPGRIDVATVCIGANDVEGTAPAEFRARFAELCAALPAGTLVADVPAVVRGPHRDAAVRLARIAREVLAGHPELVPVALHAATTGLRPWELGLDLVHPGALGFRRYTAAFLAPRKTPGQRS